MGTIRLTHESDGLVLSEIGRRVTVLSTQNGNSIIWTVVQPITW